MQLAVIDVFGASIEILSLTKEEDKTLQELWENEGCDDGLYETAMEIAGKHGYYVWEQGKSILVGDPVIVSYEGEPAMVKEL